MQVKDGRTQFRDVAVMTGGGCLQRRCSKQSRGRRFLLQGLKIRSIIGTSSFVWFVGLLFQCVLEDFTKLNSINRDQIVYARTNVIGRITAQIPCGDRMQQCCMGFIWLQSEKLVWIGMFRRWTTSGFFIMSWWKANRLVSPVLRIDCGFKLSCWLQFWKAGVNYGCWWIFGPKSGSCRAMQLQFVISTGVGST